MTHESYVLRNGIYFQREHRLSLLNLIRRVFEAKELYSQGAPTFIKVYDNGGFTIDRYTIIFTCRRVNKFEYLALKLSTEPDGQYHNEHTIHIESTSKKSVPMIGRKVHFEDLPPRCQSVVLTYYDDLWDTA